MQLADDFGDNLLDLVANFLDDRRRALLRNLRQLLQDLAHVGFGGKRLPATATAIVVDRGALVVVDRGARLHVGGARLDLDVLVRDLGAGLNEGKRAFELRQVKARTGSVGVRQQRCRCGGVGRSSVRHGGCAL